MTLPGLKVADFYTVQVEGDIPDQARSSDLIAFNPDGRRAPLFLIQTWKDEILNLQRLAFHLGADQPIFSVNPPRGEKREDFPRRDSVWSEYALQRLDRLGHDAAWRIGGWSFGGALALGVSQRLMDRGEKIETVILYDALFPGLSRSSRHNRKSNPIHRVASSINDYFDRPKNDRKKAFDRMIAGWKRSLMRTEGKWASQKKAQMDLLHRAIHVAYLNYQGFEFDAPVNLLWTDQTMKETRDLTLGWRTLIRGPFSSQRVAASHVGMWSEPSIEGVARATEAILSQASTE